MSEEVWGICIKCNKLMMPYASEWQKDNGYVCVCLDQKHTAYTGVKTQEESIEDMLASQLEIAKIQFIRQYRFCGTRKWKSDFLVGNDILVEVEGLLYQGGGGHQTYDGVEKDIEKQNAAVRLKYRPIRVTGRMVRNGEALKIIQEILGEEDE